MKILLASLYLFFLAKTTLMGVEVPTVEARLPQPEPVPVIVVEVETVEESTSNCGLPSEVSDPAMVVDWHLVYRWCELITTKAIEHGFDPALIAAIVFIESRGVPDAFSSAGAVGLMQVMSSDGWASSYMCENGPCFWDRPVTSELLDPVLNVQTGLGILLNNLLEYGEIREAIMHYGPMNYGYVYADQVLETCRKINPEAC